MPYDCPEPWSGSGGGGGAPTLASQGRHGSSCHDSKPKLARSLLGTALRAPATQSSQERRLLSRTGGRRQAQVCPWAASSTTDTRGRPTQPLVSSGFHRSGAHSSHAFTYGCCPARKAFFFPFPSAVSVGTLRPRFQHRGPGWGAQGEEQQLPQLSRSPGAEEAPL